MATERQKIAVKELMENRGNVYQAMIKAKYKKKTAKNPKNLTDSKGFQELMEQAGLTDNFLNNALYSDIKNKPKNRKPELELAYKLKNRLTDKVDIQSGGKVIRAFNFIIPNGTKNNNSNNKAAS